MNEPIRDTKYSAAVGGFCAILALIIFGFVALKTVFGLTTALVITFGPTALILVFVARCVWKSRGDKSVST